MRLLNRLKNLWEISAYKPDSSDFFPDGHEKVLVKNVSTIKKKLATIVRDEEDDDFLK